MNSYSRRDTSPVKRALYFFVTLLALIIFPWWIGALFVVGGIILYPFYFEAIILSFMLDTMFGTPHDRFFDFTFLCTLITIALLLCVMFMRKHLRSRSDSYYV